MTERFEMLSKGKFTCGIGNHTTFLVIRVFVACIINGVRYI